MDYDNMTASLNSIYEREFANAYNIPGLGRKASVLRYFFSFYRKWYSSTLLSNTYLTPGNLFLRINKELNEGKFTVVVPRLVSFKRFGKFGYSSLLYTLDDHPVVRDIRVFIDTCYPSFHSGEGDVLDAEHEARLMGLLSLQCPFYMSYLNRLCWRMGLVAPMRSIHASIAQPTKECEAFLELPPRRIFEKVVDASLSIAHVMLERFIAVPGVLSMEYLSSLLRQPGISDDIFAYVYSRLGFDFEHIAHMELADPLDEDQQDILAGTFGLGMLLGKHFFAVFGTYLRLIHTVHSFPTDMNGDMSYLRSVCYGEHDLFDTEAPFFTPCSEFAPTSLAAEHFGLPPSALVSLPQEPDMENMVRLFLDLDNIRAQIAEYAEMVHVLEIKVELLDAPRFWKRIEFSEDMSLDDVAAAVSYEFFGAETYSYVFYSAPATKGMIQYRPGGRSAFHAQRKSAKKRRPGGPITRDTYETTIVDILKEAVGLEGREEVHLEVMDAPRHPWLEAAMGDGSKAVGLRFKLVDIHMQEGISDTLPRVKNIGKAFKDLKQ